MSATRKDFQFSETSWSHDTVRKKMPTRRRGKQHCLPPRRRRGTATLLTKFLRSKNLVGAEGFEPSNTGSKGRRLTAWPRPNTTGQTVILAEFNGPRQPVGRIRGGSTCGYAATASPGVPGHSQFCARRRPARTARKPPIRSPTSPKTSRRHRLETA